MGDEENVRTVLAGRVYNYSLFQLVFGRELTIEDLTVIGEAASRQALELFAFDDDGAYAKALGQALTSIKTAGNLSDAEAASLRSEYTRLFVGPQQLAAAPWESVYVTKERLLFQKSTLKVRKAYREQGFQTIDYPHVADDHLSLEFEFMACLGKRSLDAFDDGDSETVRASLRASLDFLTDHLLVWMPKYAKDMAKIEGVTFYPRMAALANEFLVVDEAFVKELLAEL